MGSTWPSGTSTTAPSMAITAPSTAPLQVAGPSSLEPIVPIGVQLGQDTPSVNQGARPDLKLSRRCSLLRGTAPYRTSPVRSIRHPCRPLHPCRMLLCLLCQQGLLYQWVIMVRGSQFKLKAMLNFLRGQPVLQGLDLKTRSLIKLRLSVQGLHQHLADPPLPTGTTLGGLAQPLGHLRPVPRGLSIRYHLLRTLKPFRLT